MTTELTPPGMGRCEVTGKMVPDDELVVINGQRVCAEGKALLLERLKAGEGLPGEAERPTVIRRFGCIFLDSIILWIPSVGITMVGTLLAAGTGGLTGTAEASGIIMGGAEILALAVVLAYFTLMHGTSGRTVGKMAGKLRVIRLDGQPMDMKTAFIRALAYQGPAILPAVLIMIHPLAAAVGNALVMAYGLANVIVALVDGHQQRAIHDRLAGTRVVMLNN